MLRGTEGSISQRRFSLWFSYLDRRLPPALYCRLTATSACTTRVLGACRPTRYYALVQMTVGLLVGMSLLPNIVGVAFLAAAAGAIACQIRLERRITSEGSVHARYLLQRLEETLSAAEVAAQQQPVAV